MTDHIRVDLTPDEQAEGEAVTAFFGGLLVPAIEGLRAGGFAKVWVRDGGWSERERAVVLRVTTERGFNIDVNVSLRGIED